MNTKADFLYFIINRFKECKILGEKTFIQLSESDYNWRYNEESNSIAMIIHHLYGNMVSRWTDFLTTDGEKPWRNRDSEFESEEYSLSRVNSWWEQGWECVFTTLQNLSENDLNKTILIRGEQLIVQDALLRQLSHYSNHVGQIIYIAKMIRDSQWNSLSIPKGKSQEFNLQKSKEQNSNLKFTDPK